MTKRDMLCFLGMIFGLILFVITMMFRSGGPEKQENGDAAILHEECQKCREKEAKNWQDAASKRIDQLEACEERIDYLEDLARVKDKHETLPERKDHPFKIDDQGLHVNMEAVTGAAFKGTVLKDVTTDWGVCDGVGPWCVVPYSKLTRLGHHQYNKEVGWKAMNALREIEED